MPETTAPDPVAAYLAKVRARAALTKSSAHGYVARGETLPGGPCGEWLIANLDAARDVPRLLTALEAVLDRHQEAGNGCVHCMEDWPCAEYQAITTALLGEGGTGG